MSLLDQILQQLEQASQGTAPKRPLTPAELERLRTRARQQHEERRQQEARAEAEAQRREREAVAARQAERSAEAASSTPVANRDQHLQRDRIRRLLRNPATLRELVVLKTVLDRPVALNRQRR